MLAHIKKKISQQSFPLLVRPELFVSIAIHAYSGDAS